MVLDAYEFCSDAYKKQLDGPRAAWQAAEDVRAGLEKAAKTAAKDADKAAEVRACLCSTPWVVFCSLAGSAQRLQNGSVLHCSELKTPFKAGAQPHALMSCHKGQC